MEGDRPGTTRAAPAGTSIRRRFKGRADQVRAARRLVAGFLGAASPLRDIAVLLVSEAVTNALLHSATGDRGGTFEVACRLDRVGRLRVEVHDNGSPSQPRRRTHYPDALSGRGFELFDALATRWGAGGDRRGHVVWFELDPPAARAGGRSNAVHARQAEADRPQPRPAYHGGP
jgi:anti-sigma regulatory factor (Ser/Thr protein kinase)